MAGSKILKRCASMLEYLPFWHVDKKQKSVCTDADDDTGNTGKWKNLSDDIMEMIIYYSNQIDLVCMRTVCKSWDLLLTQHKLRLPQQIPWLLLPRPLNPKSLSFYDFSSSKVYNMKLPKDCNGWQFVGSSKGWLVVVNKFDIFLFNPLSGDRHQLPSLKTIPSFHNADYTQISDFHGKISLFMGCIILSSEDPSKCTVAAIIDNHISLACCRPNDKKWTIFDRAVRNQLFFNGILFCNEILYVATTEERGRKLSVKSFTMKLSDDENCQVSLKLLPCVMPPHDAEIREFGNFGIDLDWTYNNYLVEDKGEILLIFKKTDSFFPIFWRPAEIEEVEPLNLFHETIGEYVKTKRFDVYKINEDKDQDDDGNTSFSMNKVESFGEGVIFLSNTGSTYVEHTPHIQRVNCIYFTDDFQGFYAYRDPLVSQVSSETGIFYLDDDKIERPFPSVKLLRHSNTYWFNPNLRF